MTFRLLACLAVAPLFLVGCTSPTRVEPTASTPAPARPPRAAPQEVVAAPPPAPPPRPPAPRPESRPAPTPTDRSLAGRVVVVDAGHGGVDPGARSSYGTEKEIVLDVARKVAAGLRRSGASVHLTRDGDVKVPLDDRAAAATRLGADLLVSIHADSAENRSAHGFGVWIARAARRESVRVAEALMEEARRAGLSLRSIHRADFRVLVGHRRPSVLVETGFLSNDGDARRLATAEYRSRVAGAIVAGVRRGLR
ncbi:MAG: N-acetylmuramoyl-L-alanine amidase [Planctomycetota bacterium JB042]